MKKFLFSFSLLILSLAFLPGCNTINGVGRDMSAAGADISKGAQAVSRKMDN